MIPQTTRIMSVAAGTQTFLRGMKCACPWEPACVREGAVTSQPKPSTHRLWIGKRPQSVIVLLPCCIPEAQVHWLSIYHHIGRIIIKPANEERPSVTILWRPSLLYTEFIGAVNQERKLQFQWGQSAFLTHSHSISLTWQGLICNSHLLTHKSNLYTHVQTDQK